MKEISDSFDVMTAVIALILMLTVCTWAVASIMNTTEVVVDEKTVAFNTFGQEVVQPVYTAKDALMSLVVNDAYVPAPVTVIFQFGRETYTVEFNNAYFADKEASINKAWDEFFRDKMGSTIASTTLDPSGTRWIVDLVP